MTRGLKIAGLVALIAGCSGSGSADAGTDALELDASTQLDRYCSTECGGTARMCAEDEVCFCLDGEIPVCRPDGIERLCAWPTDAACPAGEVCAFTVHWCDVGERCALLDFSAECGYESSRPICYACITNADDAGPLLDGGVHL